MNTSLRFLLLQVRNPGDPMAEHEHTSFAAALNCEKDQITVHDLLHTTAHKEPLEDFDMVLFGGSGDYSVVEGGDWLESALDMMRELFESAKPTFASCWGFQAMARALGGEVVTDLQQAEVGTLWIQVSDEGKKDPVFSGLGNSFLAHMGHQDIVTRLPKDAVLLASSDKVENQAFRFRNKPIYCTQFHPEIDREGLLTRLRQYPEYVQKITGLSMEGVH